VNHPKVVITGASSGIGLATAKVLTAAGFDVFAGVRKQSDGVEVAAACAGAPGALIPVIMDVTDRQSVASARDTVEKALNGELLAGLVNNAGIGLGGPLLHQPLDEFARVMEVNVIGVMAVTQAFAPLVGAKPDARGKPGRIVNISSVGGLIAAPFLGAYAASKHAIEALSDSLRRELQLYGVDVIVIGPGAVKTLIWDKAEQQDFGYLAGTDYEAPSKRFLDYFIKSGREGLPPEEIGKLILQVLTIPRPKARYAILRDAFANWTIPRLLPKRVVDRTIGRRLGLLKN